ncbi:MAG: ABC transporter permease [Oscillospiraceae bacterium]|nr:ABC transporter permease [Oscillospiraceae bacterium]
MNILNKFTLRSLKLNKKRTTVTIIGIILSVGLITAVAGMFSSFRESIVNNIIETSGKYHTMFRDAPINSIDVVRNNRRVESYYYVQNIGFSEFDSVNTTILHVIGFNNSALENAGIQLMSGRFPENENEIVITRRVNMNANELYRVGDVLELEIFDIHDILCYETEYLVQERTHLFTREVTVVGIADNIHNFLIDSYREQGRIAVITYVNQPTDRINLFVYYEDPRQTDELNQILISAFDMSSQNVITNRELLRWQGVVGDMVMSALQGIAAVVVGVIIFTSVFVIRNGFAISVLERNKEMRNPCKHRSDRKTD